MVIISTVTVVATAACAQSAEVAEAKPGAATQTVYANGQVYTQDPDLPWAESFVTRGDRIVFVGTTEDALQVVRPTHPADGNILSQSLVS